MRPLGIGARTIDQTPNLQLPYLAAAQAQKRVTHNEAIRALDALVQIGVLDADVAAPPATPAEGDRYIVAADAEGGWAGREGQLAAFQDSVWMFYGPRPGWLAWVAAVQQAKVWHDGAWQPFSGGGLPKAFPCSASMPRRTRSFASPSRPKVNKAMAAGTAGLLFQTGFSGRAEMGTAGDDAFHIKVSADGTTWRQAIVVDRTTGAVSLPNTLGGGGALDTAIDVVAAPPQQ